MTSRVSLRPSATYCGVPVYLRYSNVDEELAAHPKEVRAIEIAKSAGWRSALQNLYDPSMVKYATDPARLQFLEVLPVSKETVALEIGVGFGQFTGALASRVRWLDTFEVRLVNAIFTKIRCEQETVENVGFACGGDDCRLPFASESYDAVFLNLVLEWCASGNREAPETTGQHRLLSEILRVLKPGGFLQLNTKNRFAYRLLLGGRDEHTHNLRFGSALPRPLLKLALGVTGKGPPPGHLHSYGALFRFLQNVGFSSIESFWAVPEMRFPEHLVQTSPEAIRQLRNQRIRQGDSRSSALLMGATPAFLVKYFAPGLFFIARRPLG